MTGHLESRTLGPVGEAMLDRLGREGLIAASVTSLGVWTAGTFLLAVERSLPRPTGMRRRARKRS